VLPGVEALTILGEADTHMPNLKAALAVERRWRAADREVFCTVPLLGKDTNDALVGGRAAG
jgi:hypothetical protein